MSQPSYAKQPPRAGTRGLAIAGAILSAITLVISILWVEAAGNTASDVDNSPETRELSISTFA